jgi:hypothetical protein
MLPCCHIALKFISGFFFFENYSLFESFSRNIFGVMFIKESICGLRWHVFSVVSTQALSLHIKEKYTSYALSEITIKDCAYFGAFLTTDSAGPISTDTNGKLVKTDVHVYGTLWLTEITKSSVMLADT